MTLIYVVPFCSFKDDLEKTEFTRGRDSARIQILTCWYLNAAPPDRTAHLLKHLICSWENFINVIKKVTIHPTKQQLLDPFWWNADLTQNPEKKAEMKLEFTEISLNVLTSENRNAVVCDEAVTTAETLWPVLADVCSSNSSSSHELQSLVGFKILFYLRCNTILLYPFNCLFY